MIKFNKSLTPADISEISSSVLSDLNEAGGASKNNDLTITSARRSPEKQARIMFDNMEAGSNISYASAGREVIDVYRQSKRDGSDRALIIEKMVYKIKDLEKQSKRVSLHCVSLEQYKRLNVIDVSKNIPNPRDLVRELVKNAKVKKVITPVSAAYNSSKVSFDLMEPAIHIEIEP